MVKAYNPIEVTNINEFKQVCGVYQIRNLVTGKIYVGSSVNIEARYRVHKHLLSKGIHDNIYLQRTYNKYGEDNFIFEIIETCDVTEQLECEQYWIDTFINKNCYNINVKAEKPNSRKGRKLKKPRSKEYLEKLREATLKRWDNPEYREHMSKIRKGRYNGIDSPTRREVVCLETAKVYISITEAAKSTGGPNNGGRIQLCCVGKALTANKCHWAYKDDYDTMTQEDINNILNQTNKSFKSVKCINTGKIYPSIVAAAKDTGSSSEGISDCCNGKLKTTNKLRFRYV